MVGSLVKIMGGEDQTQRCSFSNTSSGGNGIGNFNIGSRSSKKQKRPKKIPQRGLGVAQLEKIRLQEHEILPIPSFYSSNQPCSSSSDLSPPNSIFRTQFSVQNIDNIVSSANTVPLTCCDSPVWYKFWSSCEYNNIEKECCGLDPGLAIRTNLSLPYESDQPIWPLPSLMQRAQQSQQPFSSMVNLSSRTSSTSVLDFQMEPPSNQSYNYGNCTPLLHEEEKGVGMKRSYPFSLDNAPGPPIPTKYPAIVHSINVQVETASSSNVSAFNLEAGTPSFREGPFSTSNLEPKSKKSIKENGVFDGDFLTLAPPTTHSMSSSTKFKHPPSNNCELPDLESLAYGASLEYSIMRQGGSGLNQYYRPYFSFFPPAVARIDRATTITMANCKGGEVRGHVDLNLKL